MLVGKTDPFIAVFTRAERSDPWTLVGCTGALARLRGCRVVLVPARARCGGSSAAHRWECLLARFGRQDSRRARAQPRAAAAHAPGRTDVVPKTATPEFKKPVLADFFFEEVQQLRFQVRSASRSPDRPCAQR